MALALAVACPLCSRETAESIFELRNSPLLQNKLLGTAEEALAVPRVTATYRYCPACHFAFNPDFDPSSVDYAKYYNGQIESPSYRGYVDKIAVDLAVQCALGANSRILEIGCGSGYFLSRLQKATEAREIVAFDPAYRGEYGMQENVHRRLLEAGEIDGTFDLVVLRHSLEGLLQVASFTELIRGVTSPSSRLYFEITDLDHLLTERNPSLLFNEYYRYFSARAADVFLRQMGFRLEHLWSLFGGTYLGIIACRAPTATDLRDAYRKLESIVREHRKVLIWGTSGRCISMLSHMAWDSRVVAFGVDIDREKQGLFLPVTGQRILSPQEAVAFGPDLVIVANELYAPEIRQRFSGDVRFVSLQGRFI
jgi:SAM-dependent methyltransferase